jgi:prevent-host-death family protein
MKAADVRANWSDVVDQVFRGKTRVLVERSGVPVAAVISARDLERLNRLEAARRETFRPLFETAEAFKDIPAEELEQEVSRALEQVRAERRAKQAHQEE